MLGRRCQAGQAAVETALVLPMHLFLMLGILQMAMAYHAKLIAEYAVFKAARAASVYRIDCQRMINAAVIALGPTLQSAGGNNGPSQNLTNAINNALGTRNVSSAGTPRVIVQYWLEDPNPAAPFDRQLQLGEKPMRIHTRLGYFFEYRVPFANWILARFWLSMHTGARWTAAYDPTMVVSANPQQPTRETGFDDELLTISQLNIANGLYAPPVVSTWTMRMMSDPLPNKLGGNAYRTCRCLNDNCSGE